MEEVVSGRQKETGATVASYPFSKENMDSSYFLSKQTKIEYKAAELVEKAGHSR